ncbi:AtzG-like protein [Xylophilus sp. GOD-11R]|uniref:AtzG-like protein n=1 Tax=Xylophilus sp. GOD-11R TaxID=3089814 RepID=UPI00298C5700|nr:AtzG-like protein [Xylophilus sp. GOD-11R]WPB58274.1 AtzG-like protein [Xylophilus sp. GOD-11R]
MNTSAPPGPGALDRLLSATIDTFGLAVEPSWREEARSVVGVIAAAASVIQAADLGDRAEPAAVYRP